jgi:F-type H+-transporting ATPase subunit b
MADNIEAVGATAPGAENLGVEHMIEAEAGMPHLILKKVALPRLNDVLSERNDAISNDLEMAQLYKRKAEEAEEAYDAALAGAREQAHRIAAAAKEEVNKELATLKAKADAEIAAKSAESEGRIAEIRENAMRSVEEVAKEVAADLVSTLLPGTTDQAAVDAAVTSRLKV